MRVNVPINSTDAVVLAVLAVIFIAAIRVFIGFWKKPEKPLNQMQQDDNIQAGSRVMLTIDGMQCGMCEIHVKDAIRKAVPNATKLKANHTSGKASFILPVTMKDGVLEKELHAAIDPEGYRLIGLQAQ
jgi:copper chaperone CopZ